MENTLTAELRAFENDHAWINENLKTLLAKYPDQWIAVKNARAIASAPEQADLLSLLPNPAYTAIEFITREPLEMIL